MATSNYGKDDSTYVQLKEFIQAKTIKTIVSVSRQLSNTF